MWFDNGDGSACMLGKFVTNTWSSLGGPSFIYFSEQLLLRETICSARELGIFIGRVHL
jgi:hypothetical protein